MAARRLLITALLVAASQVHADGGGAWVRVPDSEIAAHRLADSVGDVALVSALEAEPPVRRRVLSALRAAPHASAPEALIAPLCRWAGSRDPHLAPAAARALFEIADGLDPRALAARETRLATLREAREALSELMAHEPVPRADIVFAAGYADAAFAQLLDQLGG